MVRSLPIVFGLILIIGYLVLGDILGVVSDRTIAVISGLSSAGTFLDFFVRSTLRTALFLIPALCFLTWGIAPHLRQEYIDRVVTKCARHSLAIVLVLAVVTGLMAFLFATFVIEYHPITSGDEYCYTFQARLLESGRFHAPLPPVIEPFRNRAFVLDEAWYGIGFGGHPLFLVLGLWWGAIYLTPALWAGVSVLLTYMLMRVHHDRGTALLAAIMVSLSPLFLLYHSTLLPESSSLALGLAFLFLVTLGVEKARSWLFLAAALVLALELVTRPQSAIMLGACAGTWLLLRPGVPTGVKRRALAILGIGGVAGVLGLLGYAHLVSGEPFGAHVSPGYHHDELGGARGLGFHSLRDFAQAMANLGVSFVKLNFALLGWPLSWIPLGLWLAHRRKTGWEYALGAAAAGLIAFYFFYRGRQEQYFIEAGHLLIILGALGVVRAYRSATDAPGGWRSPGVLVAMVLCSYMLGALSIWPDRVDYFRQRSAPERIVWETIERAGIHRAVVFLDSVPGEFAACVGRNSPDLDDDVILANVRSAAEIPPISRHFPDRACFRMVSTNQGGGLRLLPCEVRAPGSTQDDLSPSLMPDNQEGTAR